MPKGPLAEPKHGWNPMSADPIVQKLWEIRHQLDINVQIIQRDYPDKNPPHVIDILTGHVYDRLNELEGEIARLKQETVASSELANEIWEFLFGKLEGHVPRKLSDPVLADLALHLSKIYSILTRG